MKHQAFKSKKNEKKKINNKINKKKIKMMSVAILLGSIRVSVYVCIPCFSAIL